jgi:carbonic anhydrase
MRTIPRLATTFALLSALGCQETHEPRIKAKMVQVDNSTEDQAATRPASAEEALVALRKGNKRFTEGRSIHPHESADYRASLANEQHPFATVLACSDSRVTPVLVFDQGIGDLFVIRVAGNIVDDDVAGSIEYAVDHLGTKLLVVMGHETCGAVTAAYHAFVARDMKEREPHEIETLLNHIEPALHNLDTRKSMEEQIAKGVEDNVRESIRQLLRIHDLHDAQEADRLEVVGAIYSLRTGEVRFLEE